MTKKKGLLLISIAMVALLLVGFVILLKKDYRIELIGDEKVTVEVFEDYQEAGAQLFINDKESDEEVEIDASAVDTEVLGNYTVFYKYKDKDEITLERCVEVVDTVSPTITLKEGKVEITEGDDYTEPGYSAEDNYDGDISDDVSVEGEVDPMKPGEYTLKYSVQDSSGNDTQEERLVVVKKKVVVQIPSNPMGGGINRPASTNTCFVGDGVEGPRGTDKDFLSVAKNPGNSKNEVYCFTFVNQGIAVSGVHDNSVTQIGLMDGSGTVVHSFDQKTSGKSYDSILDLTGVSNGTYTLVATNLKNEKLKNNMNLDRKIVQAQVGPKLVKVTYPDNNIQVQVSNHSYQYDIAINVGHGGVDGGATGNGQKESEINLRISLYEAQRYRDHGLRVYLSRTDNSTQGAATGPSQWPTFRRTVHNMGEIASVSKYTYSNHHNSSTSAASTGWEILANAAATGSDLAVEYRVGSAWDGLYGKSKANSIYTKHYFTQKIYNKNQGQTYKFIDWYGMQRVSYMLFNEFIPTYEHVYLNNNADMKWYLDGGLEQMAEAKVKEYVTALGLIYRPK